MSQESRGTIQRIACDGAPDCNNQTPVLGSGLQPKVTALPEKTREHLLGFGPDHLLYGKLRPYLAKTHSMSSLRAWAEARW